MRGPGDILLVSTYELGHPPHGVALPAAFLERAGFRPAALDLAVERLRPRARPRRPARRRLGADAHGLAARARVAARVREDAPGAVLSFHGLYAPLNAGLLLRAGASAVLGGECEEDLVALARAVEAGETDLSRFVLQGGDAAPRRRLEYPVPSRAALPPLARYAGLVGADGRSHVAGYTEATRGCKHLCRHCPVVPVYRGRFFAVPEEVVRRGRGAAGRGRRARTSRSATRTS